MLENLTIAIPSRSRAQNQKTLFSLPPELWPITNIIVHYTQQKEYRACIPSAVAVVSFYGHDRIAPKRQFILENVKTDKVIMLDDDLTFYCRNENGRFHVITNDSEVLLMIETLSVLLNEYAYVGIVDKLWSDTRRRGTQECTRFNQVLAINKALLPTPAPTFRVDIHEEHDFHLQLLTQGYKTAISTEFSKSEKSDAPGGCSDWRDDDIRRATMKQFMEYWPGIVSTDEIGFHPKISWRKARHIGGLP